MRTVHVIAHPEATHHVERTVGGWHDSRLTPAGEHAALLIAQALRNRIPPTAKVRLFSSDLQRTAQTAATIADVFDVEPILDSRLREKSYGDAEGRPQEWLDERFRPPPADGDRMGHHEGVPGAETKAAFAKRIYAAMDTVLEDPCDHQIVVTHGFAVTFVLTSWIGMPIDSLGYVNFRAASGNITTLHEDDYFHNRHVLTLGDTGHLAG
ncbi:histidine phosphatase family protein [Couchioplanes caeruleus]|uniref:histidine phosphatase family protein n=1 Tax=Couchioplanes caeruleus TaxID=56438 RepID=UPI0020C0193C|nr:histidine phosphatase family protein [Couchioplanes caeruleus]UQU66540.1 histidine phosphatase family protein [Couchioplanes caeruleus]